MIRCKHVSDALRDHNWEDLSTGKRLALRFHVMLCAVCGRFNRQIMAMQSGTRRFTEEEEHLHSGCCLPDDSAQRMKAVLAKAKQDGAE